MFSSKYDSFERILSAFGDRCAGLGLHKRSGQSPWSGDFADKMNRLLEHDLLNALAVSKDEFEPEDTDWYSIGPVTRLKDMRRSSAGLHLTTFEMLGFVQAKTQASGNAMRDEIAAASVGLLCQDLGLKRDRLVVTYFGGGLVLPGRPVLGDDGAWRSAWLKAGLSAAQLVPLKGPYAFLLMVGEGERCGAICEIAYRDEFGQMVELGTAIAHEYVLHCAEGDCWKLRNAARGIYGCAYGLERISITMTGLRYFRELESLRYLARMVRKASRQYDDAFGLFVDDVFSVVDVTRTLFFLLALNQCCRGEEVHATVRSLQRRLQRKLQCLYIEELGTLLSELIGELDEDLSRRYPTVGRVDVLGGSTWLSSWNPDSYLGM